MDSLNNLQIRIIIYNKFGRDLSTIINPYIFGKCDFCNNKIRKYTICKSCNRIYCDLCYKTIKSQFYFYTQSHDFFVCNFCYTCMMINN